MRLAACSNCDRLRHTRVQPCLMHCQPEQSELLRSASVRNCGRVSMDNVLGDGVKKRSKVIDLLLLLLGTALLVAALNTGAALISEAYHVSPAWLLSFWAGIGFVGIVGKTYGTRKLKSLRFAAFSAAWLIIHVCVFLFVLAYWGFLYYLPFLGAKQPTLWTQRELLIRKPVRETGRSWTGSVSHDRYGRWYVALLGVNAGKSLGWASGSLTANWIPDWKTPSPSDVAGFMQGWSLNPSGGFIAGVSVTLALSWPPNMSVGVGAFWPNVGVSLSHCCTYPW